MMWLNQWKSDVKELEAQVRVVKGKLRQSWAPYCTKTWWDRDHDRNCGNHPGFDQERLIELKWRLTSMYQYRRQHKGKIHVAELKKPSYVKALDFSKYEKLKEDEKALQTIADLALVFR